MKVIDIALKDMLRYFRSAFAVGMMLVVPMLITGLIYLAFGGVLTSSETSAYTLPVIKLQVVNLDEGDPQSEQNMGALLMSALTDESVKNVFEASAAQDEASARAAVDQQKAALALVVPPNFTRAALSGAEQATVMMYQDPTQSFGPGITKEVVSQFLDALSGGQIAVNVLRAQFAGQGKTVEAAVEEQVRLAYTDWFRSTAGEKTWNLPVVKRLPNKETPKSVADHRTTLLGPVFAGMMVFFVFFTGTNTAQTILKEQEEGTLARLFTTPTPLPAIMGGKFAAVFFTLVVQAIVLAVASALMFQIEWGNFISMSMVVLGLVVSGAGFGIFLMSFMKSTRQAGAVVGGVLAIMGMAGGLFTQGFSGTPGIFDVLSLGMPQGWALRGLKLVLAGAAPQDVLLPLAVLLLMGAAFFGIGTWKFNSRFA